MFDHFDVLWGLSRLRSQELLEEADKYRQFQAIRITSDQRPHRFRAFLCRLGGWLVRVGSELIVRYGPAETPASPRKRLA